GMAFGVQRIIAFVKTEYLESFLNLIIVIFLLLFFASIGNVSTFFSNIGTAIASSAGISTPPSVSSLHDIYNGICNTYYNDAISQLGALTVLSLQGYAFNILTSLTISLMPNGFGVSFSPFAGYGPFPTMITTATGIISGIAGLEGGVIFLLAVIYYIFPIFLFLGLVFRAFPWTRAAGGSFLALFISFYIIFPALIYPFSTVSAQGIATLETPQSFLPSGGIASAFISGAVSQSLPFTSMAAFIDGFVGSIINSAFQLFGIIIAFVISFNLLESFGDLLGAPALASRHMLSRVI
ncbi:MAG: hypothetical protein KGH78_04360, partial [Candidatus Micrarchaeota archaeon]|nr:hypothetical protein [Candidatus Micrarchaeota archaeon]